MGMNQRHWIEEIFIEVGMIAILAVLVLCLVAPVLGPWCRRSLVRAYALDPNWEARVNADMRGVYAVLWVICGLAWAFTIALHNITLD
jgi:hypothetical protein